MSAAQGPVVTAVDLEPDVDFGVTDTGRVIRIEKPRRKVQPISADHGKSVRRCTNNEKRELTRTQMVLVPSKTPNLLHGRDYRRKRQNQWVAK